MPSSSSSRSFAQRMLQWTDRLIPEWSKALPADDRRRIELQLRLQPLYWACVPVYSSFYFMVGVWQSALVLLGFGVNSAIITMMMQKKSLNTLAIQLSTANGLFALWGIGWFMGGATSPAFWWPCIMPLLAGMSSGPTVALRWLGVVIAGSLAQIGLELGGLHAPDALTPFGHRLGDLICHPGLSIMMYATSASYEKAKNRMRDNLVAAVEQAERAKAETKLVLDNSGQGFLVLNRQGCLEPSHSAIVDRWFGAPTTGASFATLLEPFDRQAATIFQIAWSQIEEDLLPLDVTMAQLPSRFQAGSISYSLRFIPVGPPTAPTAFVVVISDITAEVARARAEADQVEQLALFERAQRDPTGMREFADETARQVERLNTAGERPAILRDLHTIKGNAALFGLARMATWVHDLESTLIEDDRAPSTDERHKLATLWREHEGRIRALLAGYDADRLAIHLREYRALLDAIAERRSHDELFTLVASFRDEPVAERFERLGAQARALAKRLGRGEVEVLIEASGMRLPASEWGPFWSTFVHAVRNSVDHGLERPEERAQRGKAERGQLRLSAVRRENDIEVSIADNGRGIDWAALAAKARQRGLPASTQDDLVAAMFTSGLTTRDEVSETSGRGVGLDALRDQVQRLGGQVAVNSTEGLGTELKFTFPAKTTSTALPQHAAKRVA